MVGKLLGGFLIAMVSIIIASVLAVHFITDMIELTAPMKSQKVLTKQ